MTRKQREENDRAKAEEAAKDVRRNERLLRYGDMIDALPVEKLIRLWPTPEDFPLLARFETQPTVEQSRPDEFYEELDLCRIAVWTRIVKRYTPHVTAHPMATDNPPQDDGQPLHIQGNIWDCYQHGQYLRRIYGG